MIDSKTRLMGLIGDPISHSKSPLINNKINDMTNSNIVYLCFKTGPNEIGNKLKSLKDLNAKGFNITIPYKSDVISFLDEKSEDVLMVGACNTVRLSNGRIEGFNTDIPGFSTAFRYDTGAGFTDKNIVIIGAGGSSKAIVYALIKEKPKSISILNRTMKNALSLCDSFSKIYKDIACYPLEASSSKVLFSADIIINTSSVGMHPNIEKDPLSFFNEYNSDQIVYDIIYEPNETILLKNASKKGAGVSNGLSMLIFQAVKSFEIINDVCLSNNQIDELIKYTRNNISGEINV